MGKVNTIRIPSGARHLTHQERALLLGILDWKLRSPRSRWVHGCHAQTPNGRASVRLARLGLVTRSTERTWDRRTYVTVRPTPVGLWLAKCLLEQHVDGKAGSE